MIIETGRVTKAERGTATVEFTRKAACGDCNARERCGMVEAGSTMLMDVVDPIGVQVGQTVQITLSEDRAFTASLIIYGIPLLAVIVGGLFGDWLGKVFDLRDILAMVGGGICFGLSLLVVRFLNNRFARDSRNQPVITGVIG